MTRMVESFHIFQGYVPADSLLIMICSATNLSYNPVMSRQTALSETIFGPFGSFGTFVWESLSSVGADFSGRG